MLLILMTLKILHIQALPLYLYPSYSVVSSLTQALQSVGRSPRSSPLVGVVCTRTEFLPLAYSGTVTIVRSQPPAPGNSVRAVPRPPCQPGSREHGPLDSFVLKLNATVVSGEGRTMSGARDIVRRSLP